MGVAGLPAGGTIGYRDDWSPEAHGGRLRRFQGYYSTPGARAVCHAAKQQADMALRDEAIRTMARHLSRRLMMGDLVDLGAVPAWLVPAPQHHGRADYTLRIASLVAAETGAQVLDILRCDPHEPLYEQKLRGVGTGGVRLWLAGDMPPGGVPLLVDNVIGTGLTFLLADRLLGGRALPLVFAVDYGRVDAGLVRRGIV